MGRVKARKGSSITIAKSVRTRIAIPMQGRVLASFHHLRGCTVVKGSSRYHTYFFPSLGSSDCSFCVSDPVLAYSLLCVDEVRPFWSVCTRCSPQSQVVTNDWIRKVCTLTSPQSRPRMDGVRSAKA